MNQKKIGSFLRELRTEKILTQEQLAEKLNVAGRTVSRWENGNNMPDLSIIVELADFYDVDIRELLYGERKSEKMDKDLKETGLKMADYAETEKAILTKRLCFISIAGLISLLIALMFSSFKLEEFNDLFMCIEGICYGLAVGSLITSIFFSTGILSKIRNNEKARKIANLIRIIGPIIMIISIIMCAYYSYR